MKILFINPPSSYTSYVPPLGVCYISSVLKERGHDVFGIDGAGQHNRLSVTKIADKVREISPDIIGITLNLYFTKGGYALARELRKFSIPIIAGGPHARVMPLEVVEHGFDIACEGEGEETFLEILEHFNYKKPLDQILGIAYRAKDGRIMRNAPRPLIEDLDKLPFADRTLFPLENYFLKSTVKEKRFYFQVFSSRGCPFRCTFCTVSSPKIRVRTPENVCDELENLIKAYGVNYFQFMDDIFTSNWQWLYRFFAELERRDLDIRWDCESRVDRVDEELLMMMKKAGLNCIFYGVESADPQTLKLIRKGFTPEQVRRTLDATAKVKIPSVKLNFILGFPWENKANILNSCRMMKDYRKRLRIRNGIVVPIPYPGTELYNEYNRRYGFTDWWLRDDAFDQPANDEAAIPYYKKNPLMADKFWLDKNFFGYNNKFKRFLSRVILKNERMAYKSYYGFLKAESVFWGSRLSLFLYNNINPKLENFFFSLLRKIKKCVLCSFISLSGFAGAYIKSLAELKSKYREKHDRERNFDWVERNIYSSLAMPILKALIPTGVSANQVTMVSFLAGLLGALCLIIPSFLWGLAGIILFQFSYLLDYVDGALARAKNQASERGFILEKSFSLILGTVILFSAGLACFFREANPRYIILGFTSGLSFFLIRCLYDSAIIFKAKKRVPAGMSPIEQIRVSGRIYNRLTKQVPSFFKLIFKKSEFLWIPIYFIDFIALGFLLNKLSFFVWFYGTTYPLITSVAYIAKKQKGNNTA